MKTFFILKSKKYILYKIEKIRRGIDRRLIVFGVFLLIATFFWFLNALSRNYTSNITIPVVYKNIPSDKVIVNELPEEFSMRVDAFGFALLKHQLQIEKQPIVVDVASLTKKSKTNKTVILTNSYRETFDSEVSSEFTIHHIYPDSLYFQFSNIFSKKVPVKSALQLQFEKQHQLKNEITFNPDSIEISGPKFILDTIEFIETSSLMLENLNRTLQRNVGLQKISKVRFNENRVVANIEIEKFTEQILQVPILLINKPDSINLELETDKVKVSFIVGLSRYNEYTADNFDATIDCDTLKFKPDKLHINFQYPYDINIVSFSPNDVDYIITK